MRAWPFEDCLLLVGPGKRSIHALNSTGAFLWELLQSGISEAEAAQEFAAFYSISPETAAADVSTALHSWRSQGLLSPENPPACDPHTLPGSATASATFTSRNYAVANTSFTVSVSNEELRHTVERRLEPFQRDDLTQTDWTLTLTSNHDATVTATRDGIEVAHDEAGAVPTILAGEIISLFFPQAVRNASLHAAAIGSQDRCVLFAGASNSGKSTLAASLARRGFDLLTDDIVWLESSALEAPAPNVHASFNALTIPFAIKLRQGSWSALQNEYPHIASLPIHQDYGEPVKYLHPTHRFATRSTPTAFVFVHYDPAHAAYIRSVDAFESLAALQHSGFWVEQDYAAMQQFLHWFERIPRFDLAWSDADAVAQLMPQLLNSNFAKEIP